MDWQVPLLIFCARICDVSIGTVRTILMVSGMRMPAAILGVFEVTIWLLAVAGVIKHVDSNPLAVVGYALGFGTGVLVGMTIEDRLALGFRVVRVINADADVHLAAALREQGFAVTRVEGMGRDGPVEMAFMVVRRRDVSKLRHALDALAPEAFVSVERADTPIGGVFREQATFRSRMSTNILGRRK